MSKLLYLNDKGILFEIRNHLYLYAVLTCVCSNADYNVVNALLEDSILRKCGVRLSCNTE